MTVNKRLQRNNSTGAYEKPLYVQVQATLQEMIEGVDYGPGDRIPSERELSELLDVSRMTVRRAVENLVEMGLLERRSTSGTFVREPQVVREVQGEAPRGLSQFLQEKGAQATSQLLSFEVSMAPRKVAEKLKLRIGEEVILIRRLRKANGQPFCIETSYLPARLLPDFSEQALDDDASLYELLRTQYGIKTTQAEEKTLEVSYARPDEAELLNLKVGAPILLMRAVVSDEAQPVEYVKSVNHPDRVVFRMAA